MRYAAACCSHRTLGVLLMSRSGNATGLAQRVRATRAFAGDRAGPRQRTGMGYLKQVCKIGPRMSGSEA